MSQVRTGDHQRGLRAARGIRQHPRGENKQAQARSSTNSPALFVLGCAERGMLGEWGREQYALSTLCVWRVILHSCCGLSSFLNTVLVDMQCELACLSHERRRHGTFYRRHGNVRQGPLDRVVEPCRVFAFWTCWSYRQICCTCGMISEGNAIEPSDQTGRRTRLPFRHVSLQRRHPGFVLSCRLLLAGAPGRTPAIRPPRCSETRTRLGGAGSSADEGRKRQGHDDH